jgi:hypothetical protein
MGIYKKNKGEIASKAKGIDMSEKSADTESGKLAIKNEGTITIIKIVCAIASLLVGTWLTYNGITASDYSLTIQISNSSLIQFTNTAPGVLLIALSILLLWGTKQNIKIR